jgi:hypothetical protein
MFTVIRKHDVRDRHASASAYERGKDACRRSAGGAVVNPFLPGTAFHKAFALGAAEARDTAVLEETSLPAPPPLSSR